MRLFFARSGRFARGRSFPLSLVLATLAVPFLPWSVGAADPVPLPRPPEASAKATSFHEERPPEDSALPDSSLPDRSVVVSIVDGSGNPVPGASIELLENYENIAEGGRKKSRSAASDAEGRARFEDLDTSLRYSYALTVHYQGATHRLAAFRMPPTGGVSARVHVYPTTTSERDAFVGMRGFVYIAQREDQFVFDVLFRVVTMSRRTWTPNLEIALPSGKKAFDGARGPEEDGFSETTRGARLRGSFPPGQKDARFSFHVDRAGRASQTFDLEIPPHVAELRVIAETTPGMTLEVPGFEPPQSTKGPDGKQVLVTRRVLAPGEADRRQVTIRLGGLPERSPARWYAALGASAVALTGLGLGLRRRAGVHPELALDRAKARARLLEELAEVRAAHESGAIGPETFAEAESQLLLALARLLPDEEAPKGPSGKAGDNPAKKSGD